jgi:hypothetical protein
MATKRRTMKKRTRHFRNKSTRVRRGGNETDEINRIPGPYDVSLEDQIIDAKSKLRPIGRDLTKGGRKRHSRRKIRK